MPWIEFFTVLAVIVCLGSALASSLSAERARHATASAARRLRLLELQGESLTDLLTQMQVELLRLANSKKMTDVRMAAEHLTKTRKPMTVINSEPDAKEDPEAWRAWMNRQLRTIGSEAK